MTDRSPTVTASSSPVGLSGDQRSLVGATREFTAEFLTFHAVELSEEERFLIDLLRKAADDCTYLAVYGAEKKFAIGVHAIFWKERRKSCVPLFHAISSEPPDE